MDEMTLNLKTWKLTELMALALKYDRADQETRQRVKDLLGIQPEDYYIMEANECETI